MKQAWRITERTALLKLTAEHQDAFARGVLSSSQAYEMARLGPAMQRVLFQAIADKKCRTFAELRTIVEALGMRERQVELPTEPVAAEATEADRERVREVQALIDRVCELLGKGFDGNEVVILRKVSVRNADVLADKLELIEANLRKVRLDLRAASIAWPAEVPTADAVEVEAEAEAAE